MRKALRLLGVAAACAVVAVPSALSAADPSANGADATVATGSDYIPTWVGEKYDELRQTGVQMKIDGRIPSDNKVGKVAKGQYVELAREGEDSIFTLLVEFGPQQATHNHGIVIAHGGTPGPLHNAIPQPDRTKDNTTIWSPNFDRAHYQQMLFSDGPGVNSMRQFYIEQSSNRYAVNGDVTDWTKVPFNEAAYGSN